MNNIQQNSFFFARKDAPGKITVKFETFVQFPDRVIKHYSECARDMPSLDCANSQMLYKNEVFVTANEVIEKADTPVFIDGRPYSADVFIVKDCLGNIEILKANLVPDTCEARWENCGFFTQVELREDGTTDRDSFKWFATINKAIDYVRGLASKRTECALCKWESWYDTTLAKIDKASRLRALIKSERSEPDPRKRFDITHYNGLMDWSERLDDDQRRLLQTLLESNAEMNKTLYYED